MKLEEIWGSEKFSMGNIKAQKRFYLELWGSFLEKIKPRCYFDKIWTNKSDRVFSGNRLKFGQDFDENSMTNFSL